jgi:hypothetical protein
MTTSSLLTFGAIILCVAYIGWVKIWVKKRTKKQDELRQLWRRKIEQLADDRATDPDGLSLDDVMNLFELPYWQEIYRELEKMPRGQRSLRKAIEIVGDD